MLSMRKLDYKETDKLKAKGWSIYPVTALIQKDTCTPMFIAALFTIAKTWMCPSTHERIKMWYIYTMEYYSAVKKNEIMPFAATQMDPEIIILNKSDKQISYFTYMWNLKNDTNELIYKTEIDSQTQKATLGL